MSNNNIGGRLLPCAPGSKEYDQDVYRGQRRRPWMCFRVGIPTPEIPNAQFLKFIEQVRVTLIAGGLLLDDATSALKYSFIESDYDLLRKEFDDGLAMVPGRYEKGALSRPIVIMHIDQVMNDLDIIERIIDHFSDHIYVIKFTSHDILEYLNEDDTSHLKQECQDFFYFIYGLERILESTAIAMPIEHKPQKFSGLDIAALYPQRRSRASMNQRESGMIDRKPSRREVNDVPPGLPPPGLQSRNIPRNMVAPPPGLYNQNQSKYHDNIENEPSSSRSLNAPPGISMCRPPGLVSPQFRNHANNDSSSDESIDNVSVIEREITGPHILSLTDVQAARRKVENDYTERGLPLNKNSSLMSKYINGNKLFARFDRPFVSISSNLDLLVVINYAVSSCNKTVHSASKEILRGAFLNGFPMKLKRKFLESPFNTGRWSADSVDMLFEIIQLYFYTTRFKGGFMLTIDSFRPAWEDFCRSYENTRKEALRVAKVTEKELENTRKLMKQVNRWITQAEQDAISRTIQSQDETEDRDMSYASETRYHYDEEEDRRSRQVSYRGDYDRYEHNNSSYSHDTYVNDRENRPYRDYDDRDETDHYRPREDRELGFRRDGGAVKKHLDTSRSSEDTLVDESSRRYARDEHEHRNERRDLSIQEERPASPIVNTDQKPRMQYKYTEQTYEHPWVKSERMDPPEDYRTLTSVPVLADYVNPKEPYLRRIQDSGVYKSAADYLDVQFRLLREDLVSPLRDGIDVYKKNGTCKGRRIDGSQNSDIAIFNVERVDGKQVTDKDGLMMRVVWPAQYDIQRLLENDREMKELGLMILSDDGFCQDFHLTMIQTSLLSSKGCIHLVILEETAPFKPNKSYQMAEGPSYLPSYKHVLENLKNINPFKPIPFERYLVHGKKEIFRPLFHRHEKSEEQIAEEKRLEKIYGDLRSLAAANRYMQQKPVPDGVDEDDQEDGYYKSKSSKKNKEEEETDLEYDQLAEPIFRTPTGVNTGGGDQMLIDKKWYRISRLLDDYHPKNLDESQRIAFCHAFRNELSLIQGPPGTGKTHIGVQIVKTMLQNRSHWRMTEPILIVCYTNSGLDNLLERVWQMIDDDEELSKDNGKPRMIRYGAKCDSEFLKRRGVMRYDVHEQYRTSVSDIATADLKKARSQKNRKSSDLALSSYTLYCSRNKLLSFEILSRVMDPNHQFEVRQFATDHIDTKEKVLCPDEALACWLLDRDFGRSTKLQVKAANKQKSKFNGIPDDLDDEKLEALPDVDSDSEDEMDLDDEQLLDKLFDKMNIDCSGRQALDSVNEEADEYYSKGPWEIVREQQPRIVVLMGEKAKNGQPTDAQIESLVGEIQEMIHSTPPLKKEELEDIKYIFSLARPKRWALYNTWCHQLRNMIAEMLPKQIESYRRACQETQKEMNKFDAEIMKMPMVIAATTSGCSRLRPMMEMVQPRILIVEEAAEVLEAHIISAMISSIEHAVMIGDHKQLRPHPSVHELGTEYGMEISMFERLAERGLPYCQLREQHRMNTKIADLIVRAAFYPNVHDADNVLDYPEVEGVADKLFFWSHSNREETPDGVSWLNQREVDMTAGLVQHFLKQNYTTNDIVVLATYSAQKVHMYHEYPGVFGTMDSPLVPIETVDSYQGKEKKIVIVSLVRSHRGINEYTGIGFLAVANRICVALTRAKHGMYIIGNGAYLMNQSQLWNKICGGLNRQSLIDYNLPLKCTAHGNITLINTPSDFKSKSPEGGCTEICNIEKECGHICERPCHPKIEYEHSMPCTYKCLEKCSNPRYQHACPKRCHEDCGSCMFMVELVLDCSHLITTPCSRIATAVCDQMCKKTIECGHICQNMCGLPCSDRMSCEQIVELELGCGHMKKMKCCETAGENINLDCVERCTERMLSCDHQCAELCGKQCTVECPEVVMVNLKCGHKQDVVCSMIAPDKNVDHIACKTILPMPLEPCGHTGHVLCGSSPSTELCEERCKTNLSKCQHVCGDDCGRCFKNKEHICQQRCSVVLPCGHTCSDKCGVKCPPCQTFCLNSCEHQSCGVGEKAFGRKCHQVCALCTSNCANKCEHQSCGKKCFEECDIRPCNKLCQKTLRCGHACLGMCGETCPKICGTCERTKYLECVVDLPKVQKIHSLIMIPKCHHVFAVEILDKHVAEQTESNEQLTCPKCRAVILGVCRYARYTKKRALAINIEKLKKDAEKHDVLIKKSQVVFTSTSSILDRLCMNQSRDVSKFFIDFRQIVISIYTNVSRIPATEKHSAQFYFEVLSCSMAVAKLLNSACKNRITSRKNIPPNFDVMTYSILFDSPFKKLTKELQAINQEVADTMKYGLIGATIPKLRSHIAKMTILNQLILMAQALKAAHTDLKESETRTIRNVFGDFLDRDERQQLDVNIAKIEEQMLAVVPSLKKLMKGFGWKELDVPDF